MVVERYNQQVQARDGLHEVFNTVYEQKLLDSREHVGKALDMLKYN